MKARVLVPGTARGSLLRLQQPLSFWGGVDPVSGMIIATGHPQQGGSVAGTVLALERSIGSSSGSSVLLELLARGVGPCGIILAEADAILTLGALVAREMAYAEIPVLQLSPDRLGNLPERLEISRDGGIVAVTSLS